MGALPLLIEAVLYYLKYKSVNGHGEPPSGHKARKT
jgi:hypothetical protein